MYLYCLLASMYSKVNKKITYFYDVNICKHGYYVLTCHDIIWYRIWLALRDMVKNNDLEEIRE